MVVDNIAPLSKVSLCLMSFMVLKNIFDLYIYSFLFQATPFLKTSSVISLYSFFIFLFLLLNIPGKLKRITIQPGRTLKVIGTVTGPLKKYVGKNFKFKFLQNFMNLFISNSGKEVLVSQIRGGEDCPIKPQVQSETG